MKNFLKSKNTATDVMATDISAVKVNTDESTHTRLGWIIVLIGVGGFMLWAMFAPLDKGVPISGSLSVASNRKAIQHQNGGTIEAILVKEGDVVNAGQPLVQMNDVQARAADEMSRIQYYTARAVEARLIAERDGKSSISFPDEILKLKSDPIVAGNISLQNQLFSSRQGALHNDLAATDESIAGLQAQLHGLEESNGSLKQQQQFLKEQLDGLRDLARDGYVARNRVLDIERAYAQIAGALSENLGNVGRTQRQISEVKLRRMQRQQEYQKEVRGQLTDVQKEADSVESRLKSQDQDLANVIVRAPVDGTVVSLAVFTRGGVVGPGFKLMDIVPSDDPLIVEGMIPVNLIDKIHPDLPVEMIFSAFNQNKTPHIPGIVTQVSADRMMDERTGQPFYRMKAKVAPEGVKLLATLPLRPGMPVEVFVKTGERTMMNYLLKPIFDRSNTALTEE
jgi:protease secretion system membrane fusion protein